MTINIELLKVMDPQHALNTLRADFDPLINTPLEAHLIDWIESLVDDGVDHAPIDEALEEHNLTAEDIAKLGDALIHDTDNTVALLNAIGEAGIDSPAALRESIEAAKKFNEIEDAAGDLVARLNTLINATT